MLASHLTVSQAALFYGVHPQTIRRWTKTGKLPCARTVGNHRRVEIPAPSGQKVVAYARVSTHDQKKDLATQEEVLQQRKPDLVIKDLGSGMNYKKAGFLKLLGLIVTRQIKELILTRKDRLLRFGSEIIFFLCQHFGVKVTILYETEVKEPMEQFCLDVIEIITVFSSKIYRPRAHSNRQSVKMAADAQV
jgi:excisionase family DNA binding protein